MKHVLKWLHELHALFPCFCSFCITYNKKILPNNIGNFFFACFFLFFLAVRKTSPPQIVHPPHLYTNSAPTVINNNNVTTAVMSQQQQPAHGQPNINANMPGPIPAGPQPPLGNIPGGHHPVANIPPPAYSSETATYVNVVNPSTRLQQQPPPYPHPQPPPPHAAGPHAMVRPPLYAGPHPGSGGHVPYSPVFTHHQHVRPVGIANVMPRQGSAATNNNHDNNTQRQTSVGKYIYTDLKTLSKIVQFWKLQFLPRWQKNQGLKKLLGFSL